MPTKIEDIAANNPLIYTDIFNTIIKEAAEQQLTRHTQSKDRLANVFSNKNADMKTNNNTNNNRKKKKEMQKKAALKMTPMPAIIKEEEEVSLTVNTVTNKKKKKQQKAIPPKTQNQQKKKEVLTQLLITVLNLHIDTVKYIQGMLLEDCFDVQDTRRHVRGILMEELLSQSDFD